MVQVAVGQFAPGEDTDANLATVGGLVSDAAGRGARVVLLPEYAMFTAPRVDHRFVDAAEPLDGPFVTGLSRVASEHGVHVVAGVNEAQPQTGASHNTLLAIGPDGAIAASYRKLHLYDAFGVQESDVVRPGEIEPPQTFSVEGVTFGLQTCYDLRFPEVTRRIVDSGADALLLGAEWVPGPLKEDHWVTLTRARAIENTIYIAAAGQNAPTGSGNSMIVDPMGTRIAGLGEETGVVAAAVSAERVAEVRTRNPSLRLRRFTVVPR